MDLTNNNTVDTGFSISEILKLVKTYFWELIKYSWVIGLLSLALGYYLYQSKKSEPTLYTANLSFMLNESSGADQNFMQQVLGSGLMSFASGGTKDLGGGSNSKLGILDELLSTRKIIQLALFNKVTLLDKDKKPKEDYLIHFYLDKFGLRNQWKKRELSIADLYFKNDSISNFSREENSVLLAAYGTINRDNLKKEITPAGIFRISFVGTSEEFAFQFTHVLYQELNKYYSNKSVEKQKLIYDAAVKRRDSLFVEMKKAEGDYTGYLNGRNVTAKGHFAPTIQTQYLAHSLASEMESYFLSVRNAEAAKIALEQQTPLLQPIDMPIYPLGVSRPNAFFSLLIGLFAGGFLGIVLVIGRKFIIDFLANEKEKDRLRKERAAQGNLEGNVPTHLPTA